jgi:hypothetical protein
MSRKAAPVPTPDHITPEQVIQRNALSDFRQAVNRPEVVKPPEGKPN